MSVAGDGGVAEAALQLARALWPYLVTVVTSGAVTALAVGSREKRALRRRRSYDETSAAALSLQRYRGVVLHYGVSGTGAADEVRDRKLAKRGSEAFIACALIGEGELRSDTEAYLLTGELFAVHDPATNAVVEAEDFRALMGKIAKSRKSVR